MEENLGTQIKNAEITPEDVETALQAVADMAPEDRSDFTARTLTIMRAFGLLDEPSSRNNKTFTDERRRQINKVTAVEIRLVALHSVIDDPRFKAWSVNVCKGQIDDHILLHPDVLRAAAETPLQEKDEPDDKRCFFDPEEFFVRLLAMTEEAGNA